ncbi:MAG: hypothetical protein ABJD11_11695 [Gemmatimonadota bacterium]
MSAPSVAHHRGDEQSVALRETSLRRQFADLYPSLRPGVWYTAAAAAGHVVANRILHDGPKTELRERELDPEHFRFRGSNPRRGSWVGLHTRRLDRHAGSGRSKHVGVRSRREF